MKTLKLTIELVPDSAWNQNIRSILPNGAWEKIRQEVLEKSGNKCVICGARGKLNCHEVWEYDDVASGRKRNPSEAPVYTGAKGDQNHTQRLAGFLALCNLCHAVKHLGFAGIQADKNQGPDFEKLVKHFMKVNACNRLDFLKHQKEAYEKFEERSHFEWALDLNSQSK